MYEVDLSLDVGPIFLTRPNPIHKWSDPTRPKINMKLWTRPSLSPTHFAQLLVIKNIDRIRTNKKTE